MTNNSRSTKQIKEVPTPFQDPAGALQGRKGALLFDGHHTAKEPLVHDSFSTGQCEFLTTDDLASTVGTGASPFNGYSVPQIYVPTVENGAPYHTYPALYAFAPTACPGATFDSYVGTDPSPVSNVDQGCIRSDDVVDMNNNVTAYANDYSGIGHTFQTTTYGSTPGLTLDFPMDPAYPLYNGSNSLSGPNPNTNPSFSGRAICPDCGTTFTRPKDLERHAQKHQSGARHQRCVVPGCDYPGNYKKDKLRDHVRRRHPGMQFWG